MMHIEYLNWGIFSVVIYNRRFVEITPEPNSYKYVGRTLPKHLQEHIMCIYGLTFDDNQQQVHMRVTQLDFKSESADSHERVEGRIARGEELVD
ncbi:hypothetical protein PIB30_088387 [Stylosanthes scabra]|uniref:Uncharacterized protein n=1 Tax=Stylosanthes scabra TaxID=79078 RepID=A0ABU6YT84_9FABA|nr:hypothetical protein [Stylosanthes scabra]